jgi:hypothetical protein
MRKVVPFFLVFLLLLPVVSFAGGKNSCDCYHSRDDSWPVINVVVIGGVVVKTYARPECRCESRRVMFLSHPPSRCFQEVAGEWRTDFYGNQYWHEFAYPRNVQIPCP